MANNRGALFETLVQILFSTDDEIVKGFGCSRQLSQEVLMSYRLLFGQCRAARRLGETLLQQMEAKHGYDQLLACLCTKPRGEVAKKLPGSFWPLSCRDFNDVLQEVDSYSSRDDFPMLGSRLAVIQEFNLRQQPSKLRDLWRDRRNPLQCTEKPYSADFAVDERNGAKRSNIITTDCDVQVRPVASRDVFDMNANRFCILNEVTSLTLEDALDRPEEAELKYHAELEQILHKHFPEYTRLEGLDFVVRRRHPHYPSDRVEFVKYEQPAAIAHSDYTPGGAIAQLKGSFPGQEAHFLDKEYDMIKCDLLWFHVALPANELPVSGNH
ncbi:putative CmcJ-like methyltransferase [Ilyonectria robusta]